MGVPTRLLEAARLQGAWQNYLDYLSDVTKQQPGIGTRGPRPVPTKVYLKPFTFEIDAADQRIAANSNTAMWNQFRAPFSSYVDETADPASVDVLKISGFRAAKLVVKQVTGAAVVKTSNRTKLKYLSYPGDSGGLAFGRNTATDTEEEIFEILRTAVDGIGAGTKRFSRQRERA